MVGMEYIISPFHLLCCSVADDSHINSYIFSTTWICSVFMTGVIIQHDIVEATD